MTAAFDDCETAITNLWQAGWTSAPTAYENVSFDPNALGPSDLAAGFTNGEPYAELKVQELPGFGQISTAGSADGTGRRWRLPGLVGVTVYVPVGRGKQSLRQLVDLASGIFRGYNADTAAGHLLFFNPTTTAAGLSPKDPAWFQATMIIRFWYDYLA